MEQARAVSASPEMSAELMRLWMDSFSDDEAYVRCFFKLRSALKDALVVCVDGRVAAAAYLLPAVLEAAGGERPFLYGYAGAVRPDARGRGICQMMIQAILERAEQSGAAYAQAPASEGLAGYFGRLGLRELFFVKELTIGRDRHASGAADGFEPCEAEVYEALRNERFSREDYVRWDRAAIQYALDENAHCAGFAERFWVDGHPCAALGQATGGQLRVLELTAPDGLVHKAVQGLIEHFGALDAHVRLPVYSAHAGRRVLVGMGGRMDTNGEGYLNLLLN